MATVRASQRSQVRRPVVAPVRGAAALTVPEPVRRPTSPLPRRTPPPQLRVVPKTPRRARARLLTSAGLVVVFAVLFGLAVTHTILVQGQQRLDGLDEKLAAAEAEYQRLRLQVAELESPDRIVAEAVRLGMVPPPGITYLTPSGAVQAEVAEATATTDEQDAGAVSAEQATGWPSMKAYLDAPGR